MQTLPEDPKLLAELLGISIPYAYALLGGKRPWTQALAISAYRKTGCRVGPIETATDDEIAVLERFSSQGAGDAQSAAAA
jgi:hypothetical protein